MTMRTKPKLLRRAVMGAVLATTLSGCAALVSDSALEADGQATFNKLQSEVPLAQDPATIDFVTCVAEAVVGSLEGDPALFEWELAIFDQPQVNAFVLPGGKISVYTGLLPFTKNDHQLAAVIGHEVAHVTERHPAERIARTRAINAGGQIATGIIGSTPIAAQSASTAIQIGSQLGLLLPFTRGQESEADAVGLLFMANAGFDPRESVKLWQNMQAGNEDGPPEFLSTHPSGETRISELITHMPKALVLYNEAQQAGRRPSCKRPNIREPEKPQK
ncbi:MAG: M48 family metallopeptidase [Pseudomonadota bacterium]